MPTHQSLDKQIGVYSQKGILLSHRRNKLLTHRIAGMNLLTREARPDTHSARFP